MTEFSEAGASIRAMPSAFCCSRIYSLGSLLGETTFVSEPILTQVSLVLASAERALTPM